MTRLLLMHSIAIITAVCLLATPTEAMPDWIKKKKENKVEDPEELFGELQGILHHILDKSDLMEPILENAGPIHALEANVLCIYVLGFDLWWNSAVDPRVVTEVFRDHANVELAKNALRPIVHEDNPISLSPHVISSVKSLLKITKSRKKALKNAKKIKKKFLLYFNRAEDVLQHQLVASRFLGKEHFFNAARQITGWVENMEQLATAAFKHDVQILVGEYKCDLDRKGDANLARMAKTIDNHFFEELKASVERRKPALFGTFDEERYKALEYRLKVFGLLGQIHEEWYRRHQLSKAVYTPPGGVAGGVKHPQPLIQIYDDEGTTA